MKIADHGEHTQLGGSLQQMAKTTIQSWSSLFLKCGGRVKDRDLAKAGRMASPMAKAGQGEPGEGAGAVSPPPRVRSETGSSDDGRPLQGNLGQEGCRADSPSARTNMRAQRHSALRQLFGESPTMPLSVSLQLQDGRVVGPLERGHQGTSMGHSSAQRKRSGPMDGDRVLMHDSQGRNSAHLVWSRPAPSLGVGRPAEGRGLGTRHAWPAVQQGGLVISSLCAYMMALLGSADAARHAVATWPSALSLRWQLESLGAWAPRAPGSVRWQGSRHYWPTICTPQPGGAAPLQDGALGAFAQADAVVVRPGGQPASAQVAGASGLRDSWRLRRRRQQPSGLSGDLIPGPIVW